jgi:hypothetical protein
MRRNVFFGLVFLGVFLMAVVPAVAANIDFDSITTPGFYDDITPGGAQGPVLAFPGLTFDGGVVMNETGWLNLATTKPNLYGSSDYLPLADNSLLPGVIKGTFTTVSDIIAMDVINGKAASTFTLKAYNAASVLLASASVALNAFGAGGEVGTLAIVKPGIKWFEVVSAQGAGHIDFAIDTVGYCQCPVVPVPGTLLLFGSVFMGLLGWRRLKS